MTRISEQIANWLSDQGVEQVFAVTGGGAMFLNHAFGTHANLSCLFMHHEQACAMAAEGYARVAGIPAVVNPTTGPGSINAFNGVYGAFTDSIPMIVISGQIKRETCAAFFDLPRLRQLGDQEGPTIEMAQHICKFAKLISNEEDLETALPQAFSSAISGRPGPVWLDIPLDIQQSTMAIKIRAPAAEMNPPEAQLIASAQIIAEKLSKSRRPIILGGTGVRLSGAENDLLSFAELFSIPVATAWTHDLIPSDHELFAGRPGTIGTRSGNFCLQASDFVLVLGSRLNIRQTSYNWGAFAKNAWVAQVDIDAAELSKPTYSSDLGVEADVSTFIKVFRDVLSSKRVPEFSSWVNWVNKIRIKFDLVEEHRQKSDSPLNPYVVVDRVFKNLRDDDIVVCGNASACIIPFQIGSLRATQRLFSNSGSASMGYDLPAAIGAAVAGKKEGRRVVCFAGDGSLQLNIQELQTLKTSGLNVVLVVLNNKGYLSIWQTHENFFGTVIGATPESGVEFPDFTAVATSYGVEARSIKSLEDFEHLPRLMEMDGPLLIDVHVDPHQEFAPRLKSRMDEDGNFVTPELDDMYPFLSETEREAVRREAEAI